jgi:putative protein-disulfide isomerase
MDKAKPTLYYIADPLCGWCYGFTPVVEKLLAKYGEAVSWKFLIGGLAVGDKIKPMAEIAHELRPALDHIADRTGALFQKAFYHDLLARADVLYDSYFPGLSFLYLLKHGNASWTALLATYHKGIFQLGLAPDSDELLELAAGVAGLPADGLKAKVLAEENSAELRAEYAEVSALKVTSFPSLVIGLPNGVRVPIVEGYTSYNRASALLSRMLAMPT